MMIALHMFADMPGLAEQYARAVLARNHNPIRLAHSYVQLAWLLHDDDGTERAIETFYLLRFGKFILLNRTIADTS